MSYYYNTYHCPLDTMVCTSCEAQAFTWMAESFVCPDCGGRCYVFPTLAGENARTVDEHEYGLVAAAPGCRLVEDGGPAPVSGLRFGGKRKRLPSEGDCEEVATKR